MQYAQLNASGTYESQINSNGNVQWDANNFCPAAALVKDGKAEQFRIVELHETDAPEIDPMTQSVMRDGGEFVGGRWQYKWRIDQLTDEEVAAKQAKAAEAAQEALKLSGVEILGVMCSATKEDQSGLSAVALGVTIARANGQVFPATRFEFQNGNSLVITDANFNAVYAAWAPFRQSFFAVGD
jgi:hypothetical protein